MAQVKALTHTITHSTTQRKLTLSALALALSGLASTAVHADQLADIQKAGVVKVATFDANPPFGSIDAKTHDIVGYDVDFAKHWPNLWALSLSW